MTLDLKELERTITYLQNLHEELRGRARPPAGASDSADFKVLFDPVSRCRWETKPHRVSTLAGLSNGEHEEICDANYARQKIQFSKRPDGMWRNENPVYFPVATGTYGADSILLEGGEFRKRVVARMAQPVMCVAGMNGVGFAPNALTVTHDVMLAATRGDQLEQAPISNEFTDFLLDKPVSAPQAAIDAHNEAVYQFYHQLAGISPVMRGQYSLQDAEPALPPPDERVDHTEPYKTPHDKWDRLEEMQKHGLLSASGLNPVEPQDGPGYCAQCERISLPRRNQLVSMGHSVSHLVQLPDEQGYALPCKSCRKP